MVYLWLISRVWVGRDQIILLALGEKFANTGILDPVAKGMSGGGTIPGSLLQILVGLPLMLWQDYRAPILLIGVLNLFAGLVIYRVAKREFDPRTCFFFFALYWLSPWRMTDGAGLWEPAYLFLPAAIHFWASSKLSNSRRVFPSIALGIVLLATPQLHGSFIFLWILTGLLVWKKKIQLDWRGLTIGGIIGALTLIPMGIALATSSLPTPLPTEGFIGKGFLYVFPFLKGILYWFRMPTLDLELRDTIYLKSGWASTVPEHIFVVLLWVLRAVEVLTIALSLLAAWWYIARIRSKLLFPKDLLWVEWFAWYAFIALAVSGGLAPITLQDWHVIIALPAAAIIPAIWGSDQSKKVPAFQIYFIIYLTLATEIAVIIGCGEPSFRVKALPKEVITTPSVSKLFPPGLPIEQ